MGEVRDKKGLDPALSKAFQLHNEEDVTTPVNIAAPKPKFTPPPTYVTSTAPLVGRDDDPGREYNPIFAESYVAAYGAKPTRPPIHAEAKSKTEGAWKKRSLEPRIARAFVDFYKQHKEKINHAVDQLARRHSDIDKRILFLAFNYLILTEFILYDKVDLIQDAAATMYANVGQDIVARMKKEFPSDIKIATAFTGAGSLAWQFESFRRDIPIGSQGLGPLQIIPDLALAANKIPDLIANYENLSASDFTDKRTVVHASFDPDKMFSLKAATLDIQITALKNAKLTEYADILPEKSLPREIAKEIQLVFSAIKLVQFPETAPDILDFAIASSREEAIASLALVANLINVAIKESIIIDDSGSIASLGDRLILAAKSMNTSIEEPNKNPPSFIIGNACSIYTFARLSVGEQTLCYTSDKYLQAVSEELVNMVIPKGHPLRDKALSIKVLQAMGKTTDDQNNELQAILAFPNNPRGRELKLKHLKGTISEEELKELQLLQSEKIKMAQKSRLSESWNFLK